MIDHAFQRGMALSSTSASILSSAPTATHTDDGYPILCYVRALFNYNPTQDDEISFNQYDIIAVTDAPEHGWWRGQLCDASRRIPGRDLFPSNYTIDVGSPREELLSRDPAPAKSNADTFCGPVMFHVKALFDYTARGHDDFDFKAGDIIAVVDTPEHLWWQGELLDETRREHGRDRFPSDHVLDLEKPWETLPPSRERVYTNDGWPILFYVRALYDYLATIDEEFDFKAGDIIAVTDAFPDGWWSGELLDETRRETGRHVFPSNYVRLI